MKIVLRSFVAACVSFLMVLTASSAMAQDKEATAKQLVDKAIALYDEVGLVSFAG